MTQITHKRETFSGRRAFIFAAIGSAVGLGNIWRFPYVTYENGGGAIVINSLFMAMKYCVFVVAMVGVAPVVREKKFQASIVCAIVAVIVCLGSTAFLAYNMGVDNLTMLIATGGSAFLGIVWAVLNVRSVISKPLPAEQEDEPAEL